MHSNFLQKLSSRRKALLVAVAATVLAGSSFNTVLAKDYDESLVLGVANSVFRQDGVTRDGYGFKFTGTNVLNTLNRSGIYYSGIEEVKKPVIRIGKQLTINAKGSMEDMLAGIYSGGQSRNIEIRDAGLLEINASNSYIKPEGRPTYPESGAAGILLSGGDSIDHDKAGRLIINSNVKIEVSSVETSHGIRASASWHHTELNGDTSIKIMNKDAKSPYAIFMPGGAQSPVVNINYNHDFTQKIGDDTGWKFVNTTTVDEIKDESKTVQIDGDLYIRNNWGTNYDENPGRISIGLSGEKSYFHGVSMYDSGYQVSHGVVNLALMNGAQWIHEKYGNQAYRDGFDKNGSQIMTFTGGATQAKAGFIYQKDVNPITLRHYSGYTTVFYEHANSGTSPDDYKAGDVNVLAAKEGSSITVLTDSKNIDMQNEDQVYQVLNSLAGKLVYKGAAEGNLGYENDWDFSKYNMETGRFETTVVKPEHNLKGQVGIASGLTSAAEILDLKDLTFNPETGRGEYIIGQSMDSYDALMNGIREAESIYTKDHVLQPNKTYLFVKDTTITNGAGDSIIRADEDIRVDARTVKLNLQAKNNGAGNAYAIKAGDASQRTVDIRAQELLLQARNEAAGEAAAVKLTSGQAKADFTGAITMEAHAQKAAIAMDANSGSITVNGKLQLQDEKGSWGVTSTEGKAIGLKAAGETGSITVKGSTDLKVAGDAIVTEGQAKIGFEGDVKVEVAAAKENYAIRNEGGTVDVHAVEVKDKSTSGNEGEGGGSPLAGGLMPLGGVGLYDDDNFGPPGGGGSGETTPQEPLPTTLVQVKGNVKAVGTVNLGMETKESFFEGVALGEGLNLTSIYGATWTNQMVGQAPADFKGSTLASYTGSNFMENAGQIMQKDAHDLTINNYKGNAYLIYEHSNAGSTAEDYAAGDTIIKQAAEGSQITVMTDSKGIDLLDNGLVSQVLDTLAGKLTYVGFTEGERNLQATVQIADGLTSSSAKKEAMDVVFNEITGQGGTQVAASFEEALTGEAQELYAQNSSQLLDKSYLFTRDTTVTTTGLAALTTKGIVSVNAGNHELQLHTDANATEDAYGIQADKDVNIKAQKLMIEVKNQGAGAATGIQLNSAVANINGDLQVNVQGQQAQGIVLEGTDGALNVNGNLTMKAATDAIVVKGSQNDLSVNAGVNITTEGFAVNNSGGSVELNPYLEEKNVRVIGDINAESETILGMAVDGSYWKGVATGDKLVLRASNNATWYNELSGNEGPDFKGSVVAEFMGGPSASMAGVIYQKDTHDLTINNYRGYGYVLYEHTDDGTAIEHYTAGDTIVKKAAPKAQIVLSTDNSNIDMDNKEQVNAVLSALAGKLYYEGFITGENNLSPKVQIADGLTAAGAQKIVDIEFNPETGQGFYKAAQSNTVFTEAITGAEQAVYRDDKVQQPDKKYLFSLDTRIDGSTSKQAVAATEAVDINTKGHDLQLYVHNDSPEDNATVYGMVMDKADVKILTGNRIGRNTPGLIDIDLLNKGTGAGAHAIGISFNSGSQAKLTIDGNLKIGAQALQSAIGIDAGGGQVEVNGDLSMWFTMNGGSKANTTGIKASAKDGITGGQVTINGATNMMIAGTAVAAEGNSVVNLNGDININLVHRKQADDFAIRAGEGSIINLNADMASQEVADKVFIKGHIDATGEVNLGLTGAWDGMLKGDNLHLSMWRDARWNPTCEGDTPEELKHSNIASFKGMDQWSNAGTIYQQQAGHRITMNDYSGKVYVVYNHNGNGSNPGDYMAGDTVIKHAAEGSGIILTTSNKGISSVDRSLINDVLNTLAGKLVYEGYVTGERNLDAQVQIADGMTAAGVKKRVDVKFDEETGRGGYTYGQKGNVFNEMMTGTRQESYQKESAQDFDNAYIFTKDSSVTNGADEDSTIHAVGGIIIDTVGHILDLNAQKAAGATADLSGIRLGTYADKNVEITTGFRPTPGQEAVIDLNVNNQGSGTTTGILFDGKEYAELNLHGSMDLLVAGKGNTIGIDANNGRVDITGNLKLDAAEGYGVSGGKNAEVIGIKATIEGENKDEDQHKGTVVIRNDASITVDGDGLVAIGEGASIDIWGVIGLKIAQNAEEEHYAVRSEKGGLVKLNAAGRNNVVTIEGNILAEGEVATQLVNDKAFIHGIATGGGLKITANNGGYWINESYGKRPDGFTGSHIALFDGTSDKTQNARTIIYQKDAGDLTIDKYEGHSLLIYEHANNGMAAEDFAAGDTIIKDASNWSDIIVSTDRNGINMDDENNVQAVLCNLANKLWYMSSDTNTNLQAKVQIADGLTGASEALQIGDIRFNEEHQGEFVVESMTPGVNKFKTTLTGEIGRDGEYEKAGVIQGDGTEYVFRPNSVTKILVRDASGVALHEGNVDLTVDKGTLRVATEAVYGNYEGDFLALSAFSKLGAGQTVVNADKLELSTKNIDKNRAEGLHLENDNKEKVNEMVVNGSLNANVYGKETVIGVFTKGNSSLKITGDVNMKGAGDAYGVDNLGTGGYGYFSVSALYAGSDYKTRGSDITVEGATDILVNGSGAVANGGGATINLAGPTQIITAVNDSQKHYALAAASGTINVNMVDGQAGDKAVVLQGNVGVLKDAVNANEAVKHSEINLALNHEDSSLKGVIINQFVEHPTDTGDVNLTLAKGATWENVEYGMTSDKDDNSWSYHFDGSRVSNFTGGSNRAQAGVILQKDAHDLTIGNYSGHSYVIYEHTGNGTNASDYVAGDTIIKHAAEGAEIVLSTDNNGINMSDIFEQNKVLDTLAGKLTYEAFVTGEENLQGKVQIASGLTAAGAQKIVDITFDKETGKGGYVVETDASNFDAPLTGQMDPEYQLAGVQKDDLSYVFTEDVTIRNGGGDAAINAGNDIKVKADGKQVALVVKQEAADEGAYGIKAGVAAKNAIDITAGAVNIDVQNLGEGAAAQAAGIYLTGENAQTTTINGALNINRVVANRAARGIYAQAAKVAVKGDLAMKNIQGQESVGIEAVSNEQGAAQVLVEGNAALNVAGTGIILDGQGATLDITGTTNLQAKGDGILLQGAADAAELKGKATIQVDKRGLVAAGEESQILLNEVDLTAGAEAIVAQGNKALVSIKSGRITSGAAHYAIVAEKGAEVNINAGQFMTMANTAPESLVVVGDVYSAGKVNLNLLNDKSVFKGLTFADGGEINLQVVNGAQWFNEGNGAAAAAGDFQGSEITKFIGGTSFGNSAGYQAGVIHQKDTRSLTIKDYSGYAVAVYEHDKAEPTKILGGDLVINKAASGSAIKLYTDNNGLDMHATEQLDAILGSLAQKLIYSEAVEGQKNLQAEVLIAGGLTSSSTGWQGDVAYDEKTGQGSLVAGSTGKVEVTPIGGSSDVEIITGPDETTIMRSVRSVTMSNMLMWTDNAQDMGYRAAALRQGEENGVWARSFGGKAKKYEGGNTQFETSYWGAQVGYDAAVGHGWNLGTSFNYMDGDGSYEMGGEGDNKLYSLGAYASKKLGTNGYLDLSAKFGQVEGDYTVYNEIQSTDLSGKYKAMGYSFSAQIGKRLGDVEKLYFEPQMQLTWSHLNGDNYDAYSKAAGSYMSINQDALDSVIGRVGLEVGRATAQGGFYGSFSFGHEFSGDVDATYRADDGGAKSTSFNLGESWSELTLGGYGQLGSNSYFYADVTKSLSGDYKQEWKVDAGINFSF